MISIDKHMHIIIVCTYSTCDASRFRCLRIAFSIIFSWCNASPVEALRYTPLLSERGSSCRVCT